MVLSAMVGESSLALDSDAGEFQAMIVAGDPNGTPADSPANRVDANTTDSPFAGVGSLQINTRRGTYICTATPISATHILTAGHCVDINNDGKSNGKDGITGVTFHLNYGGNLTHSISASAIHVHPDFTGFNRPSVNDDLAVIALASPLPGGVPFYGLASGDLTAGTTLTMVGYGRSGDGVNGYYVGASFSVKRVGENNADAFYGQDDTGRPAANEVFRFDFDGPSGNGTFGGPTLGNDRETTLGGGDSGGPSFVLVGSQYLLAGVNTFTQGFNAPKFGSLGGGINVFPYVSWIDSVLTGTTSTEGGGSGKGAGGQSTAGIVAISVLLGDSPLPLLAVSSSIEPARLSAPLDLHPALSFAFGPTAVPLAHSAAVPVLLASSAASPNTLDVVNWESPAQRSGWAIDDGGDENSDNLVPAVDAIFSNWHSL